VLTVGNVDVVRQEEIRADEHIEGAVIELTDSQSRIADLLAAEPEAREWRDPACDSASAKAGDACAISHPRCVYSYAGALAARTLIIDVAAPVSNRTCTLAPLTTAEPVVACECGFDRSISMIETTSPLAQ
jgi:hypothetical protein